MTRTHPRRATAPAGDHARTRFESLHDEIEVVVKRTIGHTCPDASVRDEVAQDVMLEIWSKADRINWVDGNPLGWAITIARRRSIDRLRSDRARTRRELDAQGRAEPTASFVSEDVMVRLDRERLSSALLDLDHRQREAIVLAYFGGCTYADVARVTGVPLGTTKRRIRDGMARLRTKLSDLR